MYKSLRLKQALESKIGRIIEKEIGLKQTERDSIILVVGQGRRRLKDHIEEFAVALKTSLLLPEMDEGEQKQFVEAKIQEFVSDLSGLRMEKIGKEEDEGGEMQEAEVPEFIRGFKVGVPRAEDCLERSRKARLQTAEKEFLERHRNCKAEVEGAVVIEEEGPGDHLVTEIDEESFAGYREGWEITWGNGHGHSFENLTLLSSMLFTHCTPGCIPIDAVVGRTFQVYSVRITETKGFKWPLKVYGVVAARDEVDRHRNPLFLRSREDCQILYKEDSFLHLTGPCRAIVSHEPVDIEIQLRVKGAKRSEDRPLMSHVFTFKGEYLHHLRSSLVNNRICTIELSYQQLKESIQATLFGVRLAESSPFDFGVRLVCSSLSQDPKEVVGSELEVVLFDSKYGEMPMDNGYLNLSRQVVSVELKGLLRVHIQTYTPSGGIAACGVVFITPKTCNTSHHRCVVGDSSVEFTVAWSLLVEDEMLVLMNGCVDPYEVLPRMHPDVEKLLGLPESSWG